MAKKTTKKTKKTKTKKTKKTKKTATRPIRAKSAPARRRAGKTAAIKASGASLFAADANSIGDEFNSLSTFVRKNVGNGTVADWGVVRTMMLKAFGAPNNPALAITRINTYYGAFADGKLKPGGASMKVHAEMKARMDTTRDLVIAEGAADKLGAVKGIGGFNIRLNANNANALSNHSFGIAMDLDASLNPNLPMKAEERKDWADLVAFLTGIDPYGDESKRLQSARTYAASLADVTALANASRAFVDANSTDAKLADAVKSGFLRLLGLTIGLPDSTALLTLAAPPDPDQAGLLTRLGTLNVPAGKRAAMAKRLVYAMRVFTLAKAPGLKPKITGTAATTARFGFINLPAEVITGLAASDGGKLRWLGTANVTKDYMHFDFRDNEHPPLF